MRRRAVALIVISPRASASRLVTGLSPTSTMRALPFASRCESFATLLISLRQVEREALERHSQIDALELDVLRNLQRARREVQDRFDSSSDHLLHNRLRVRRWNGDHRDVQTLTPNDPFELLDVVDRYAAA